MKTYAPAILWAVASFGILLSCSDNGGTGPGGGGSTIPAVTATVPAGGSLNVTTNSNISITFNTAMDPAATQAAISTVPIIAGGTFTWTGGNTTLVMDPAANLSGNTAYTVTVAATARSAANRAMARDTSFVFHTVPDTGTTTPIVVSTDPADAAIGVPINTYVSFTFNVPMDVAATQGAISSNPAISGTFTWDNGDAEVTWIPSANLRDTTRYTVTVTTAARSKAGVTMTASKTISFTTGTTLRPPTRISGYVMRKEDNGGIVGANVVLYNANTSAPLLRATSGIGGVYQFTVDSGDYYLSAAAAGRLPAPPPGGRINPFHVSPESTKVRNIYLVRDSSGDTTGGVSGTIQATGGTTSVAGILVIATRSDSTTFSTTTGPDGYYVFYNLPVGTYTITAFRSGLAQDSSAAVTVTVVQDSVIPNLSVTMAVDPGRRLEGRITYLASNNSVTDITLVDPATRTSIPGLRTFNDAGLNYQIRGIPPGSYIAWASYLNDGYVMDPDAIRKFGLPTVSFAAADTLKSLNFDVTGAVTILRPTNPPENLVPAPILSINPYFVWQHYSSAKQYIVEVVDQSGTRIWGGWDNTGRILGGRVQARPGLDSAQFNFDSTATEALRMGGTYAWKVYADFDNQADVGQLISSSEDLRGLFMAGVDTIFIDTNYVARPLPKLGAR